jgi:serine/threonine protein kinase
VATIIAQRPRANPELARAVLARPGRRLAAGPEVSGVDYVLGDLVGKGNMGEVFAATQVGLERLVAVKVLRPGVRDDAEAISGFLAEALVAAELDHPNTVPVYEIGVTADGLPFYAMKLITGSPWSRSVAANSLDDNLAILLTLCDVVQYAHDKGIIHRDLKPDNVMIGAYGEILLVDWGLAASVGSARTQPVTPETSLAGTPAYMPPEVAAGELARIGKLSDVYVLGGILYEIITGLLPHTGKNLKDCLAAAARNELQPTDARGELLEIARKALNTEPAERFASAKELQQTVRAFLAHRDSLALADDARRRFEDLPGVGLDDVYRECHEIIALYLQALKRWPENPTAAEGLFQTRSALAGLALRRGEIMLARSQGKAMEHEAKVFPRPADNVDEAGELVQAALLEQERRGRLKEKLL